MKYNLKFVFLDGPSKSGGPIYVANDEYEKISKELGNLHLIVGQILTISNLYKYRIDKVVSNYETNSWRAELKYVGLARPLEDCLMNDPENPGF